jgi:uncharacterized damage-inducible protein DinB
VSHILADAFGHHTWATRHLLRFLPGPPTRAAHLVGSRHLRRHPGHLDHILLGDGAYLRGLTGSAPDWVDRHRPWPGPQGDELADLDELTTWVDETEKRWSLFLSEPFDTERVQVVNNGTHEVRAGVILAQVLHHANAHREQICAILIGMGLQPPDLQPPDLQPWAYAWTTGRIWSTDGGT